MYLIIGIVYLCIPFVYNLIACLFIHLFFPFWKIKIDFYKLYPFTSYVFTSFIVLILILVFPKVLNHNEDTTTLTFVLELCITIILVHLFSITILKIKWVELW